MTVSGVTAPVAQVELKLAPTLVSSQRFQLLTINLLRPGNLFIPNLPTQSIPLPARIEPAALEQLELPEELDWTQGIVLYGAAPTWLYAHLVDRCQAAPWVACYAMTLGAAVVVKSSVNWLQVGDTIPFPTRKTPGLAIVVGGPPNSGKSVFSNALRWSLARQASQFQVYLHRANWDGEGNWSYETVDRGLVEVLVERGKYKIHQLPNADQLLTDYFSYHAQAVKAIRQIADLVIVDVGGMPQATKMPVIEACTHYIVISSKSEEIQKWHDLFAPHLQPLVVIHSKLEDCYDQRTETRFLEIEAGRWQEGETYEVPQSIIEVINKLLTDLN
ncbi:MAG: CRISPR-associated protein Csx3 [Cyanobacteria bacterium CRU_2_1]|nr:CRISPR-associated protein Csx3 [Cyanobacteria bacterium CRU_2_1]